MVQAAAAAVWGCATSSRTRRLLTEIGSVEALLAMLQMTLVMDTAPGPVSAAPQQDAAPQSSDRDRLQVENCCFVLSRQPCSVLQHVCFGAYVHTTLALSPFSSEESIVATSKKPLRSHKYLRIIFEQPQVLLCRMFLHLQPWIVPCFLCKVVGTAVPALAAVAAPLRSTHLLSLCLFQAPDHAC